MTSQLSAHTIRNSSKRFKQRSISVGSIIRTFPLRRKQVRDDNGSTSSTIRHPAKREILSSPSLPLFLDLLTRRDVRYLRFVVSKFAVFPQQHTFESSNISVSCSLLVQREITASRVHSASTRCASSSPPSRTRSSHPIQCNRYAPLGRTELSPPRAGLI